MRGLILSLYDFFEKNRLLYWLVISCCFLLISGLALRVSFEEDISKMLQVDTKSCEYFNLIQNTGLVNKLVKIGRAHV